MNNPLINKLPPNLASHYGMDITAELEDLLVQELSAAIDAQIINDLFNRQRIRKEKIETIKNRLKSSE